MDGSEDLVAEIETLAEKLNAAKAAINTRFIGQEQVVRLVLSTLLCGGHGLLVGVPGLGKTRLVETMSTVMGLSGSRVQFTMRAAGRIARIRPTRMKLCGNLSLMYFASGA